MTYGDGVADVDIARADRVSPGARQARDGHRGPAAGPLRRARDRRDDAASTASREKPAGDGGWINGGFFVLAPKVLDYIDGDDDASGSASRWRPRRATASSMAYRHDGFWQPMDTLRDKNHAGRPVAAAAGAVEASG